MPEKISKKSKRTVRQSQKCPDKFGKKKCPKPPRGKRLPAPPKKKEKPTIKVGTPRKKPKMTYPRY